MVLYKCERCNKKFNMKNDYRRHINRKNPCSILAVPAEYFECSKCHSMFVSTDLLKHHLDNYCPFINYNTNSINNPSNLLMGPADSLQNLQIKKEDRMDTNEKVTSITSPLQCGKCNKIFTRSDNLKTHKAKYCYKNVKSDVESKVDEITPKQLNEKIIQLQKQIEALTKTANNGTINNINNIITTTQNISNDIKMIGFGKENLYELISDEEALKYLKTGYQSVYNMIEDIHFNPDKPEFHNVFISDKNRGKALIYDGNKWYDKDVTEVVEQVFDDKAAYLTAMFKDLRHRMADKYVTKFIRFRDDDDEQTIANLKKDIQQLLYNKRDIPRNTKKRMRF